MLDRDLAILYGVETRALNQTVRKEHEAFSRGFYVSINERRNGKLEITNCDIQ